MDIIKVILTSFFSALILFIIAKIMGHRQVSQLDFFDYITGITIGSISAEMATELETPWKPAIAMVVYGTIAFLLNLITSKFPRTRKYINGSPAILMSGGKLYRKNMKKAKLDLSEFLMMCREEGYFDLNYIQTAVFENNGKLTVLPKSLNRPATPEDLNLNPKEDNINTEIIMDGRILEENLKRIGLDLTWLNKQLKAQGYRNAKEIYLGLCDKDNQLSLFALQ